MNSGPSVRENLDVVDRALGEAPSIDLLLLPENFAQMPIGAADQHIEADFAGEVQQRLSELAKHHHVNLMAGSIPIFEAAGTKPFARSILLTIMTNYICLMSIPMLMSVMLSV